MGPELVGDGPRGLRNTSGTLLEQTFVLEQTRNNHETSTCLKTDFLGKIIFPKTQKPTGIVLETARLN